MILGDKPLISKVVLSQPGGGLSPVVVSAPSVEVRVGGLGGFIGDSCRGGWGWQGTNDGLMVKWGGEAAVAPLQSWVVGSAGGGGAVDGAEEEEGRTSPTEENNISGGRSLRGGGRSLRGGRALTLTHDKKCSQLIMQFISLHAHNS
jgi:hypothetical protein